MKKAITAIALLAGAATGYAQGEISFAGNETGFKQVVYSAAPENVNTFVTYDGYTTAVLQGSTSTAPETPKGTTTYGGSLLTGTGYDAELLGAAGAGDYLGDMLPLLTTSGTPAILNFFSGGTASGLIRGSIPVVVPGTGAGGGPATIAIAVWNNEGGTLNTLAEAQAANPFAGLWGISALANINTTTDPNQPAAMSTASNLNLSFSLGVLTPEPGMLALGVMGLSAFLFRRNAKY